MTHSDKTTHDEQAELDAEALRRFVDLYANGSTPDEETLRDTENWRDATPGANNALGELESLKRDLNSLVENSADVVPFPAKTTKKRVWPKVASLAVAACLAAFVFVKHIPLHSIGADHATEIGERKTVTLDDGSKLTLDARTAVNVTFDGDHRLITLKTGRALFEVSHDAERPFIVEGDGGQVRVLGTIFEVDVLSDQTRVGVFEGEVQVSTARDENLRLTRGMGVGFAAAGDLGPIHSVNLSTGKAWVKGQAIFDRVTLGDVFTRAEAYTTDRFVIMDADLKNLEVTGVYQFDDVEGLLASMEQVLPLTIIRLPFLTIIQ